MTKQIALWCVLNPWDSAESLLSCCGIAWSVAEFMQGNAGDKKDRAASLFQAACLRERVCVHERVNTSSWRERVGTGGCLPAAASCDVDIGPWRRCAAALWSTGMKQNYFVMMVRGHSHSSATLKATPLHPAVLCRTTFIPRGINTWRWNFQLIIIILQGIAVISSIDTYVADLLKYIHAHVKKKWASMRSEVRWRGCFPFILCTICTLQFLH